MFSLSLLILSIWWDTVTIPFLNSLCMVFFRPFKHIYNSCFKVFICWGHHLYPFKVLLLLVFFFPLCMGHTLLFVCMSCIFVLWLILLKTGHLNTNTPPVGCCCLFGQFYFWYLTELNLQNPFHSVQPLMSCLDFPFLFLFLLARLPRCYTLASLSHRWPNVVLQSPWLIRFLPFTVICVCGLEATIIV